MNKELRYEMMAVFLRSTEDFGEVQDDIKKYGFPYYVTSIFTEEEQKEMMFLLNGGHEGCTDPYSFSTEDEPFVTECITEALHSDLDGCTEGERLVIRHFLYDVALYVREGRKMKEERGSKV